MKRKDLLFAAIGLFAFSSYGAIVRVEDDSEGRGTVSFTQREFDDGLVELTLKAVPSEGFVFSEWIVDDSGDRAWPADTRHAGPLTVLASTNAEIQACFISRQDDELSFDLTESLPSEVASGEALDSTVDVTSSSFPRLTFEGLPPGVRFDAKTLVLSGRPTEPGYYEVTAHAVNESGFTFTSFSDICVGGMTGQHISGIDVEVEIDQYASLRFEDLFACAVEIADISLSGLPPGLVWNADWKLAYGTPTTPGRYMLKAVVRFAAGGQETVTCVLRVVTPDPSVFDVDLRCLEDLRIGDVLEASECEIGVGSGGSGIASVTGLPSGLRCEKWWVGNVLHWGLAGQVNRAGRYSVWVEVNDPGGEEPSVVRTCRVVEVGSAPQYYLAVVSEDTSAGTVSGGGPVAPEMETTIVATPQSGYVFAGWFDEIGEMLTLSEGIDYREPRVTFRAGEEYAFSEIRARFIPSAEDTAPELLELDGATFVVDPETGFETYFDVFSPSLSKLTFKGLPSGFASASAGFGSYSLIYDPALASGMLKSGRYDVTLTAENKSRRSTTVAFRITVLNVPHPRIRVAGDYGEFYPGEAIEAIRLDEAVDFNRGEELSVSGLPKGLAYNTRANAKTGVEAHTITGTPTVPGEYTLEFRAKIVSAEKTNTQGRVTRDYETVTTTSFMTVLPYPELLAETSDEAAIAGCKVTGAGNYKPGTKVTLKATPARGWVFAGWIGLDDVELPEAFAPTMSVVTGEDDLWVVAEFLPVQDDWLYIDEPYVGDSGFAAELPLKEEVGDDVVSLIRDLIDTGSRPTVKVTGLPAGLKFSTSTFLLSGKPTKSGVSHVTVSVKNAGGYSFVRVFDLAVLDGDGVLPQEKPLGNEVGVDFSSVESLITGVRYAPGDLVLAVPPRVDTGAAVKKVLVSGLPAGLSSSVSLSEDAAEVSLTGIPTRPGRFTLTLTVNYVTGKAARASHALVVQDGGSRYLFVESLTDGGTVSGAGVYAAGQTVKLAAKPKKGFAFAGWLDSAGEPFATLPVDFRSPSVSFQFCEDDFEVESLLYGDFIASEADRIVDVRCEDEVWEIEPTATSRFACAVDSASLPKVTVKGMPKGAVFDLTDGGFSFTPSASTVPGVYQVTLSIKNSTVSRPETFTVEVHVANRTSAQISGIDPAIDAYPATVGVDIEPVSPVVEEGWSLSVKGLPAGLSFKNGVIFGAPTKVGDYTVVFTATSGKGTARRTETATIVFRVGGFPAAVVGTYSGLVRDGDGVLGSLSCTVAASGRISAKLQFPDRNLSFARNSWLSLADGRLEAELEEKGGSRMALALDSTVGWSDWQLTGTAVVGDKDCSFSAQRNPYGAKDGDSEARSAIRDLVGTFVTDDGWKVKVAASGAVTLSGKFEGRTVSASSVVQSDGECYWADLIKFYNKDTVLSICAKFEVGQLVIVPVVRHIK